MSGPVADQPTSYASPSTALGKVLFAMGLVPFDEADRLGEVAADILQGLPVAERMEAIGVRKVPVTWAEPRPWPRGFDGNFVYWLADDTNPAERPV